MRASGYCCFKSPWLETFDKLPFWKTQGQVLKINGIMYYYQKYLRADKQGKIICIYDIFVAILFV